MIQMVVVIIILAAAVTLSVIYLIRQFVKVAKKESECSCCDKKNSCREYHKKEVQEKRTKDI